MSGHSKWATIKHKKGAADAKRGKLFAKLIKQVEVAARQGGGDPDANPTLRTMFQKARDNSVPLDTIERAVKRGTGELEGVNYETITYEGYAPGGVAVLVEVMTDNRNRTVAEVRHAFTKRGGNLGTDGSVAYLFSRTGLIQFAPGADEDKVMEAALDAGAEDVVTAEDGSIDVLTHWEHVGEVRDALVSAGLEPAQTEVTMLPSTEVTVDADTAASVVGLIDMLEDLDDVQNVYSNADISEEILSAL